MASFTPVKDRLLNWRKRRRLLKSAREALRNLTPEEKTVLADFILFQTKSQNLDFQSGVTNGLEHAHIIYRSATVGSLMSGFAYNLQPWDGES
jgi:Super-infection exclusion protein B